MSKCNRSHACKYYFPNCFTFFFVFSSQHNILVRVLTSLKFSALLENENERCVYSNKYLFDFAYSLLLLHGDSFLESAMNDKLEVNLILHITLINDDINV